MKPVSDLHRLRTRRLPSRGLQATNRQQAQRIVPERVDLDRLAAARCYDPIANFCIHSGQSKTFHPLGEESVIRVDFDAETCAVAMMPHDVLGRMSAKVALSWQCCT
jgi:hypothetical protein